MQQERPRRRSLAAWPVAFAAALATAGLAYPSHARGDEFGGFSADQSRYLVGRDKVCSPIRIRPRAAASASENTVDEIPVCQRAGASRVAELKFRRGIEQRGSRAKYAALARGSAMTLRALSGAGGAQGALVTWRGTDPISRVVAVYLSQGGKAVAVEYEVRFGGRLRIEVIGFALPSQEAGAATRPGETKVPGRVATTPGPVPAVTSKELDKALAKARKLSQQGSSKAAITAYSRVLKLDPKHSEARYGLASNLARRRQLARAIAELETLAASDRADAIVWLVEARFDKRFARLRANTRFRLATGLDRKAGDTRAKTVYERLVGFTTTWEQSEIKCEKAEIDLDLTRLKRAFQLRVISRCGGYKDVTRLRGTWTITEGDAIVLTLPNKKKADEKIQCAMNACGDGSGEDCLQCGVDSDLSFTVRPVRR